MRARDETESRLTWIPCETWPDIGAAGRRRPETVRFISSLVHRTLPDKSMSASRRSFPATSAKREKASSRRMVKTVLGSSGPVPSHHPLVRVPAGGEKGFTLRHARSIRIVETAVGGTFPPRIAVPGMHRQNPMGWHAGSCHSWRVPRQPICAVRGVESF